MKLRGLLALKALDLIERFTYTTADLLGAILSSSKSNYLSLRDLTTKEYKTFAAELTQKLEQNEKTRLQDKENEERIYHLVYRLRKDGLITKNEQGNWNLTSKGLMEKDRLVTGIKKYFELPRKHYKTQPAIYPVVVAFDIPEKQRGKRDWLRATLISIGLRPLQKSLLVGRVRIPAELIADLKHLKLLDYIEIFSITKRGTIRYLA